MLLIAAGLLLWTINIASNRSLFIDEANVARNLYDRSYTGLFRPLDYQQYAAPLYLTLTKLLADLLGYREWAMRLPAFFGGLMAVYALVYAGKRLLGGGYWTLLPLGLLFTNTTVLRYVTEVKPYSLDLGIAAALIALHLRPRPNLSLSWWTVIGILAPWFSLPAVFVLAAIGLLNLLHDRKWLIPIAGWLVSFALLYLLVLQQSVGTDYLNSFHNDYFFSFPTNTEALGKFANLLLSVIRLTYGFTTAAIIAGSLLMLVGIIGLKQRWLALPLLIVAVASAPRFYSLIDRLILFVLPGVWLLTGLAARSVFTSGKWWAGVSLLLIALLMTGTDAARYYLSPMKSSDGRVLAQFMESEVRCYADPSAVPVLDYYRRIHPVTSVTREPVLATDIGQITDLNYLIVFDVANDPGTLIAMDNAASVAAARGCKTSWIMQYRSAVLRVKCP